MDWMVELADGSLFGPINIRALKREGLSVLLSEQNVKFALKHSDRAYIVDKGTIKYQGTIAQLEKDEEIKKQYLAV